MTVQRPDHDLVLDSVTKSFGDMVAVDGVSLRLAPGEFFSLLGPSGCGKTTTLRLVAGFEQPDSGSISVRGQRVEGVPPDKRPVNTVFQHYALFPHMTVEGNVGYGLRQRKLSKEDAGQRVRQALETVRLTDLADRYPRQLSGGQQQRVALARALINEPTVLLLDEPLAALDLKLRKAMQGELKSLQARVGVTFLYVTHDQEEALTLSDRIAVMDGGRVLQSGTPQEIYERPVNRFVADFIGEANLIEGIVERADTDNDVLVRTGGGAAIRCSSVEHLSVGTLVSVCIRPERVRPATETDAENHFEARVVRRVYLGGMVRCDLSLAGEQRVAMEVPTGAMGSQWIEGEVVNIAWEGSDSFALRRDDADLADEADRALVELDR